MSNSIRVNVLCAVHMAGVSQRGRGSKYDFAEVRYLVPFSDLNTEHCVRTVSGLELVSVSTDKSIVEAIKSKNFTYPVELELELSADLLNLQRNICVGFSEVKSDKPDPLKKFSV